MFATFAVGPAPRLARHAHLPLQSGCDAILRAMFRRYRPWHYAEKLARLGTLMPDAALGADVMVGFPGETDAYFEETYRFLEAQPFTYLHLFPFSARPGTPAWKLQETQPVHGEAVNERMGRLRALAEAKGHAFRQGQVGRELSVVTLRQPAKMDGAEGKQTTSTVSDNFLAVEVAGEWPADRLMTVRVTELTGRGLRAMISA